MEEATEDTEDTEDMEVVEYRGGPIGPIGPMDPTYGLNGGPSGVPIGPGALYEPKSPTLRMISYDSYDTLSCL
jgi:hypothetical protein